MKRSLTVISAIFVAIILTEFGLNLFFPIKTYPVSSKVSNISNNDQFKRLQNISKIRGPKREFQKNKSYRIVIIGDSVAYGIFMKYEDTYSAQLEKLLNKRLGGGFEVINLSVPGYSIFQSFQKLKEYGMRFQPDLVIYGYWHDDIQNNVISLDYKKSFCNKLFTFFPYSSSIIDSQILIRCSLFSKKFLGKSKIISEKLPEEIAVFYNEFKNKITSGSLKNSSNLNYFSAFLSKGVFSDFFHHWQKFFDLSQEKGFKLVTLITPVMDSKKNQYNWAPLHNLEHNILKYHSLDYIDLSEAFLRLDPKDVYQVSDPVHPNKKGNSIIAENLFEYLKNHINTR